MMLGETARDIEFTAQQEINAVMVEAVNRFKTEIEYSPARSHRLTFIYSDSIGIEHEQEREKIRKDCLGFCKLL